MTANIIPSNFNFQSNTVRDDGLVNITALAVAYTNATGIRCNITEWLNTKEATESIAYLASYSKISQSELVVKVRGGKLGGTWVHPDLAEIFAQWISVEYRFAVVQLIRTAKTKPPSREYTTLEDVYAPRQQERQLPPVRDAIDYVKAAEEIRQLDDPILKSYLLQMVYEEIGATKALPPSDDVLVVAAVKARSLGYALKPAEDSKLGKWVAKHCNPLGKTQHGRYEVNVYRDDARLVETIGAFFA